MTAARPRRPWRQALLLCLCLFAAPLSAQPDPQLALEVEAAYLVNFLRYTDWPAEQVGSEPRPYVIGVIGPRWVARTVRAVAGASDPIRGRAVRVLSLPAPQTPAELDALAARVHLLFIAEDDPELQQRLIGGLARAPVLTVANDGDFVGRGGMLGLIRHPRTIGFAANPDAIREAGLVVSAKVLKLAELTPPR